MSQIDAVLEIVGRKSMLDRDQIVPETKLVDLGISSLNMVELICDIEEELGIELPFNANTRAKDFRTLGDVIAAVEKQLAAKG